MHYQQRFLSNPPENPYAIDTLETQKAHKKPIVTSDGKTNGITLSMDNCEELLPNGAPEDVAGLYQRLDDVEVTFDKPYKISKPNYSEEDCNNSFHIELNNSTINISLYGSTIEPYGSVGDSIGQTKSFGEVYRAYYDGSGGGYDYYINDPEVGQFGGLSFKLHFGNHNSQTITITCDTQTGDYSECNDLVKEMMVQ